MSTQKKPTVLVTDNIHASAKAILEPVCNVVFEKKLSAEELLKIIPTCDALMIRSASQVNKAILEAGTKLQIVGRAGVGTDNIDLETATQRGVIVVNSPDGNTVAASEHTIGMIYALARHIPEADSLMRQGLWERNKLVGTELFGKTLGVIGLGRIGNRVAKACLAFGMKVLVYDPFLTAKMAEELGVLRVELPEIWAQADFITIHAPKTKDTANLLNAETLAKCKKGVRIINCARGGMIDEAALAKAIESGHVAGAALDVFSTEPPTEDNPLIQLAKTEAGKNLVITPHLGASTEEAQLNVALDVAEQIKEFFEHGYARSAVNLPMLRKEILDPVRHYMPMAEVLGHFVRQFASGVIQRVEIVAKGALADPAIRLEPITLAVLKGLLDEAREGVNYVNAQHIAEERGIEVKTSTTKKAGSYLNLLEVSVVCEDSKSKAMQTTAVAATLIAEKNFRIVEVNGASLTLEPTPYMLLTPHQDKPGMIAKVATILGSSGVNISALQVAREGNEAGGRSLMIFNLDNPPSEDNLSAIKTQEGIFDAQYVSL